MSLSSYIAGKLFDLAYKVNSDEVTRVIEDEMEYVYIDNISDVYNDRSGY